MNYSEFNQVNKALSVFETKEMGNTSDRRDKTQTGDGEAVTGGGVGVGGHLIAAITTAEENCCPRKMGREQCAGFFLPLALQTPLPPLPSRSQGDAASRGGSAPL